MTGADRKGPALRRNRRARSRPLRVALTHSPGRLDELASLLEARGYSVVRRPLLRTVPRTDPHTRSEAEHLSGLPWMLLTSRSTVEALLALEFEPDGSPAGDAARARVEIGAVGPATAAAAEAAGWEVAFVATPHNADGLANAFLAHPRARGPVGLPRGNRALLTLEQRLGEAGYVVRPIVVYDTVAEPTTSGEWAVEAVVLASPSAVEALPEEIARNSRLVTLGSTTTQAVLSRGWNCEEAAEPTPEATLAAVERVLA